MLGPRWNIGSRWMVVAVFTVALGFVIWLAWGGSGFWSPQSPPVRLRIGLNNWPGYEFAFLAEELGYFEEEGLDLRLMEFSSLGDARRAFERGRLDGFFSSLHEVLESHERGGRRAKICWIVDSSAGADEIIALDSIQSISNLKGKRIAIEPGSVTEFVLTRALDLHGLKITDVVVVPMSQLEMDSAIQSGEIEAMVTYPPVSLGLRNKPGYQVLFSTREIPDEVIDILSFDDEVLRNQLDEIQRFIRAFDRAMEFYAQSPEDAIRRMARRQGVSPEELRSSLSEGIRLYRAPDQPRLMMEDGPIAKSIHHLQRLMFVDRPVGTVDPESFLAHSEKRP